MIFTFPHFSRRKTFGLRVLRWTTLGGMTLGFAGCAGSTRAPDAPTQSAAQQSSSSAPRARTTEPVAWQAWSKAAFEEARSKKQLVLVDAGIEGCTACRNMHAETYQDAEVVRRLKAGFVTVSVDADQQPDLGERFAPWGWPATIFLDDRGEQVLAVTGSRSPEDFLEILDHVGAEGETDVERATTPAPTSASKESLDEQCQRLVRRLDEVSDEYGWGGNFRPVEAAPLSHSFWRAHGRGDREREQRALRAAKGFAGLIDPVWGGVFLGAVTPDYQGFVPEKRLIQEANALQAFADAELATGDPSWNEPARGVLRYLEAWMQAPDGTFYSTQDDLPDALPDGMDGQAYYALDDAERRRVGVPEVDHGVYTDQNGRLISALARLFEAHREPSTLALAERATASLLATRMQERGFMAQFVSRPEVESDQRLRINDGDGATRLYLAPQVYFGLALVGLYDVNARPEYLQTALQLAAAMNELEDRKHGGFHAALSRDGAVERQSVKPYVVNLQAARFLIRLAALTQDKAYHEQARRTLEYAGRPDVLQLRGPENIATHALALEEYLNGFAEVSIVGDSSHPDAKALFDAALSVPEPRRLLQYDTLGRYPKGQSATLYVCTTSRCSSPIKEPAKVRDTVLEFGRFLEGAACSISP